MNSYTLYCDAAGGKDHGFIVVAGYLSTFSRWLSFTKEWNLLLSAFTLSDFHMKDFAQSKGAFADWKDNEDKRKKFLSRAAEIIASNVERSFACLVEFEAFNRVNQRYRLDELGGVPYSLAARSCVAKTANYLQIRDATYIFEGGDKGKGDLIRIMERDGYPSPAFRPSRNQLKNGRLVKGIVALQAADFAAYELRKAHKDDSEELWPLEKYRKSLRALSKIPGRKDDWGILREQELIALCRNEKRHKYTCLTQQDALLSNCRDGAAGEVRR